LVSGIACIASPFRIISTNDYFFTINHVVFHIFQSNQSVIDSGIKIGDAIYQMNKKCIFVKGAMSGS